MAIERFPAMVVRKYQERKVHMGPWMRIFNGLDMSIELKSQIRIGTGTALRLRERAEKPMLSAKQQTRYRCEEIRDSSGMRLWNCSEGSHGTCQIGPLAV